MYIRLRDIFLIRCYALHHHLSLGIIHAHLIFKVIDSDLILFQLIFHIFFNPTTTKEFLFKSPPTNPNESTDKNF